jgi:hypothetical protein
MKIRYVHIVQCRWRGLNEWENYTAYERCAPALREKRQLAKGNSSNCEYRVRKVVLHHDD